MAKTGYLIAIYQDINPSSPTYNQTREERLQDETKCPYRGEANWIEDTKYCELTDNGMLTGYEITVYRDVEPLSSTYNQTREEKELNPTDCEADSSLPNWQNIGEPFCRQKIYLPGGLMDNDGYMVQEQQDMNEYSETAEKIREVETLDLENCPLPNTEPVWQIISESCHLVTFNGQLVYDGTKDVIRVNTNQYSPSWNNNVPETANIEDETNCPSGIEKQYRWVVVDGQTECVGYDKYSVEKKQQSVDGGTTWIDVSPLETRAGEVIEANSADCGYNPTYEYRWIVVDGQYECVGYDKYAVEKKQQSSDGGQNWTDVEPLQTRNGSLIEANSTDCGYVPPTVEYRWVTVDGLNKCVGYNKYSVEKKQQSTDGGTTWTDVSPIETRQGELIEANSTDCGYVPPTPGGYENQYLTFEAIEDGTFTFTGRNSNSLSYSLDDGQTWTALASGTASPTVTAGNKIMWKGTCTPSNTGSGKFSSTGTFNAYGNTMSIVHGDNFRNSITISDKQFDSLFNNTKVVNAENLVLPATTLAYGCYQNMFDGCTNLVTAPTLPATTLVQSCYFEMFQGCTSLTTTPELPATTLAQHCYWKMFYGCTSLETTPVLPVTTLAQSCYGYMFSGCTSLTSAPELPATTLADGCYGGMFSSCTGLTSAPELPATTLAEGCYSNMFHGCTSLTTAPELPVTTLEKNCYAYMFQGCTGLTSAPELPATTLADGCYYEMFEGCTRLTTAPVLPATTLVTYCYYSMFQGCTSLTTAPELPATTLASWCYYYMFAGCTNLNYIKCLATDISAAYCTDSWVYKVASSGRFVKNSAASWTRGNDGIPTGWTVINQ